VDTNQIRFFARLRYKKFTRWIVCSKKLRVAFVFSLEAVLGVTYLLHSKQLIAAICCISFDFSFSIFTLIFSWHAFLSKWNNLPNLPITCIYSADYMVGSGGLNVIVLQELLHFTAICGKCQHNNLR